MIWSSQDWKANSSAGPFARRTSPALKAIDQLVETYHNSPPFPERDAYVRRTVLLAAIVSRTGIYLNQHTEKEARRSAVTDLKHQAVEALRVLRPPIETRTPTEKLMRAAQIHGRVRVAGGFAAAIPMHDHNYMLEAYGLSHFEGGTVAGALERWLKEVKRWEDSLHEDNPAPGPPPPPFWERFEKNAPAYLKKVTYLSETERDAYLVNVHSNELTWACGGGKLHSVGSQRDVFIFVISPQKKLYAGEMTEHEFHHSSFLGGMPVLAAGEIIVNNGRLTRVSNESGHYRPDPNRHYNALLFFKTAGSDLSTIRSKVAGHPSPEFSAESSAQTHFDLLRVLVTKVNIKWKMAPATKLGLFHEMEPEAQAKFLEERGMTADAFEGIQVNSMYGEAGSTGAPQFLPPAPL